MFFRYTTNKRMPDEGFTMTVYATSTLVGATVSALVYTAIATTGEVSASMASTGIELSGELIAYGAEAIGGTHSGNVVRGISRVTSSVTRPVIHNTSRIAATGISLLAGAISAFTTNLLIFGGKKTGDYIYQCNELYKQSAANRIQYSEPVDQSVEELVLNDAEFPDVEENESPNEKHKEEPSS